MGVAVGGAIGSVLRHLIQMQSAHWFGSDFPYGTLIVNVTGSLLIGFLSFVLLERVVVSDEIRFATLAGFLGGFTTFSTFSLETLTLMQQGSLLSAIGNTLASVGLCLMACLLGMVFARSI